MLKILIADDDSSVLISLKTFLRIHGYPAVTVSDAESALKEFASGSFQLVILDVFLGQDSGIELCRKLLKESPDLPILMISGESDLKTAVETVKAGARDFLEKPVDTERLKIQLRNAEQRLRLGEEKKKRDKSWLEEHFYVGKSPRMVQTLRMAEKAASSDIPILIGGPNGCGKDLLARYIYRKSLRSAGEFVPVNCAAVPQSLFESSFFGHKKGAFTGAEQAGKGYFLQADGGTLFLDEIGEIPLMMQARLLRALEQGEIQPAGAEETRKVDVRILAATNRDLPRAIREGEFREDLYHRLMRIPLTLPSLEERREDLPGLIDFLWRNEEKKLSEDTIRYLCRRAYPGNIRELQNLLDRASLLCESNPIEEPDLHALETPGSSNQREDPFSETRPLTDARRDLERRYLRRQLEIHGFSVKKTAEALEMLPNNLSRRLAALEIPTSKSD